MFIQLPLRPAIPPLTVPWPVAMEHWPVTTAPAAVSKALEHVSKMKIMTRDRDEIKSR